MLIGLFERDNHTEKLPTAGLLPNAHMVGTESGCRLGIKNAILIFPVDNKNPATLAISVRVQFCQFPMNNKEPY